MRSRSIASLALIALLLLPVASAHAAPLYQWTFTGDCVTGCVGQATWDILTATTQALDPDPALVPRALYQDSNLTEDFRSLFPGGDIIFVLPLDGFSELSDTETFGFRSFPGGAWRTSAAPFCELCSPYMASGINGVWVESGPI